MAFYSTFHLHLHCSSNAILIPMFYITKPSEPRFLLPMFKVLHRKSSSDFFISNSALSSYSWVIYLSMHEKYFFIRIALVIIIKFLSFLIQYHPGTINIMIIKFKLTIFIINTDILNYCSSR